MTIDSKKSGNKMADNQWKYVVPVKPELLKQIEVHFKTTLPSDYKVILPSCNQGKPSKMRFDIEGRKECVLNYLANLNDVIATSQGIKQLNFIPIGDDPFGNLIGFLVDSSGAIIALFFWDHETGALIRVCESFSDFLKMLY